MRNVWLPAMSSVFLLGQSAFADDATSADDAQPKEEATPVATDADAPTPETPTTDTPAPAPTPPDRLASYWFIPGLLLTGTLGRVPAFGVGGEASVVRVTDNPFTTFGLFGQAQLYNGEYGRYAGGVEMGWLGGLELGADFREAHGDYAGTYGVHAAAFFSLGFTSLALRFSTPVGVGQSAGLSQGFEGGLAWTLKAPLGNYDKVPFSFGHGRPPRRGRAGRRGSAHAAAARLWQDRTTQELASVTTFMALARDLAVHGAPRALCARALRAAADEWEHAQRAATIARALGGSQMLFVDAQAPCGARLTDVVRDAVSDGVFGEGLAASVLRAAANDAGEGLLRRQLGAMATEEQAHAELAADIVRWAFSRPGARTALAAAALQGLARTKGDIDDEAHAFAVRNDASLARACGLVNDAQRTRAATDATRRVQQALESLV